MDEYPVLGEMPVSGLAGVTLCGLKDGAMLWDLALGVTLCGLTGGTELCDLARIAVAERDLSEEPLCLLDLYISK